VEAKRRISLYRLISSAVHDTTQSRSQPASPLQTDIIVNSSISCLSKPSHEMTATVTLHLEL